VLSLVNPSRASIRYAPLIKKLAVHSNIRGGLSASYDVDLASIDVDEVVSPLSLPLSELRIIHQPYLLTYLVPRLL
jgi:hypothetical protein